MVVVLLVGIGKQLNNGEQLGNVEQPSILQYK